MTAAELLYSQGYLHLKDVLSKELCHYLTHLLSREADVGYSKALETDPQVPTAKVVLHHELVFETILEKIWPDVEDVLGEEVLPTYAYARLYSNGDELKIHTDRAACEISMTIQLGRSHHYAWPIYMAGNRVDMAEGDGVIYLGNKIEHWRNVCDGPTGYYSGQVFLHYVKKYGENTEQAADMKSRPGLEKMTFVKNRTLTMENK